MKKTVLTLTMAGLFSVSAFAEMGRMTNASRGDAIVLICQSGEPMMCRTQDPSQFMSNNPTAAGQQMGHGIKMHGSYDRFDKYHRVD
jgi:hypothetical protein